MAFGSPPGPDTLLAPYRLRRSGMGTFDETQQAVLDLIADATKSAAQIADSSAQARAALRLAEALAWVRSPNQPHGGGAADSS